MKKGEIILVGCGELARMIYDNIEDQNRYELVGLTSNKAEDIGRKVGRYSVVCTDDGIPAFLKKRKGIVGYFLGVGHWPTRAKIIPHLDSLLEAVNVIHPTSVISRTAKIGKGNLIEAFTKISNDVVMGNHNIVNSFTAVNHDQVIGNNVLIAGNVSMAGKSIGDNTIVADGASIGFKRSVGKNCIVGDGAVVTKDVPDNVIVYGNPAKIIRRNSA